MATAGAKKALLIGNNDYEFVSSLRGAVNDMRDMEKMLRTHEDGTLNFYVEAIKNVCNYRIQIEITKFLNDSRATNSALIYFAGHGKVDPDSGIGYICGTNVQKGNPGVSMRWLVDQINNSSIQDITLILDCCHAGAILNESNNRNFYRRPRQGLSILAATTKTDVSNEFGGHGVFTSQLLKGLSGAAADSRGFVYATNLHRFTSDSLTPFQQQPVFESSSSKVSPLRECLVESQNSLIKELVQAPFFTDVKESISISGGVPTDRGFEMDHYLTLSFYDLRGYLEIEGGLSLQDALEAGSTCKLSDAGKKIWTQIQESNSSK